MPNHKVLSLASGILVAAVWPGFAASAGTRTEAAKQGLQIVDVSEHCIDEFDEDLIIYVTEGEKDCVVKVRVTGRGKSKSKVALEYFDTDDGWTRGDYKNQTTTTAGRATFKVTAKFPTDPDSYCYDDDSYTHRFAVATVGKYRSFRSAGFEVVYNSADDNPACTGGDSSDDEDDSYWDE
jgi:hypothetical protein